MPSNAAAARIFRWMYQSDADTDTPPASYELRLYSAILGADGTNDDTELVDANYAAQTVTLDHDGDGDGHINAATFPQLTAPETAASWGLHDASSGDQIDQGIFAGGWTLSATTTNPTPDGAFTLDTATISQ